jgi:hypothetical protein
MKKLFLIAMIFFGSCTQIESLIDVNVELPKIQFSTPATQAGTFPLVREVDVTEIERVRGTANVSLTSLKFSVIAPDTLTLDGFTAAKLVVSANGKSVTVYNSQINPQGRVFNVTTSADITSVLDAAKTGNGKMLVTMSVTKNNPTVPATWEISTVANIQ